ncbi:MAG TPA: autotransporter assembly complex family protein [Candidatus Binatia bacterium]|nr:autotransporter assembly complex family protein [Candidatus Binatia bacterium]
MKVHVDGVHGAEKENVEARLSIRDYAEDGGHDADRLQQLHRRAEGEIRQAMQAYGHYAPTVRATLDDDGGGKHWRARYDVDAGPQVRLFNIELTLQGPGAGFPPLREALERVPLKRGEPLRHGDYETAKMQVLRAATDAGFLDARFTEHTLAVDAEQRRADVRLVLDTGPRYFFGEVTVTQDRLDPVFLARYVPIRPGDPFNPQKLLQTQFALGDLGYFGTVDIQARRDAVVDQRVPIDIRLTPRPRHRYDVGLGYGTDTGPRVSAGTEFRNLNRHGHRLRLDTRVSEVKKTAGAEYRVPLGTRAGEYVGLAGAYTDERIGDGRSRHVDFGPSLSRSPGEWQRRHYLTYLYEESFLPATGNNDVGLLMPGSALSRDQVDGSIHARKGWYLFSDVHGAYRGALSDVSFVEGHALLRGAYPLGLRTRLFARAEFGAVRTEDFAQLPPSQRFFAGGDQSVRGYGYQSLGPRDPVSGKIVGGRYLTVYSVEAEYRVWGNWGVAAFFDAGNASDDRSPSLYRGIGPGIRYAAPIGTLSIDLAHPLDGDSGGIRPHLGLRIGL